MYNNYIKYNNNNSSQSNDNIYYKGYLRNNGNSAIVAGFSDKRISSIIENPNEYYLNILSLYLSGVENSGLFNLRKNYSLKAEDDQFWITMDYKLGNVIKPYEISVQTSNLDLTISPPSPATKNIIINNNISYVNENTIFSIDQFIQCVNYSLWALYYQILNENAGTFNLSLTFNNPPYISYDESSNVCTFYYPIDLTSDTTNTKANIYIYFNSKLYFLFESILSVKINNTFDTKKNVLLITNSTVPLSQNIIIKKDIQTNIDYTYIFYKTLLPKNNYNQTIKQILILNQSGSLRTNYYNISSSDKSGSSSGLLQNLNIIYSFYYVVDDDFNSYIVYNEGSSLSRLIDMNSTNAINEIDLQIKCVDIDNNILDFYLLNDEIFSITLIFQNKKLYLNPS
jgi:hypothetical protein